MRKQIVCKDHTIYIDDDENNQKITENGDTVSVSGEGYTISINKNDENHITFEKDGKTAVVYVEDNWEFVYKVYKRKKMLVARWCAFGLFESIAQELTTFHCFSLFTQMIDYFLDLQTA